MVDPIPTSPPTWLVELVERLDAIGLPVAVRDVHRGRLIANTADHDVFGTGGGPWPSDTSPQPRDGVVHLPVALDSPAVTHVVRIVVDVERAVAAEPAPSIDASRLDALAGELSPDIVDGLLATFLAELDTRVAAIESGHPTDGPRAADVLRTASLLVGATGLADECARIERGADPGPALRRHAASARTLAEWWRRSRLAA